MAKTSSPAIRALTQIASRMARELPEHPAARQLQGEVNRLRQSAEALDNLNRIRNPLDTPAAHALKVGKRAKALREEANASLTRAGVIWGNARDAAERRLEEKVNLRPNAFAEEIRTAFRGLDSAKRIELLGEWVEEGKGPELAAIIRAPSFLSGISDNMKANFERSFIGKHAAAEMDEIAKLDEVHSALNTANRTAYNFARDITDPGNLAKIEREASEADAAAASFDQSLQQQ